MCGITSVYPGECLLATGFGGDVCVSRGGNCHVAWGLVHEYVIGIFVYRVSTTCVQARGNNVFGFFLWFFCYDAVIHRQFLISVANYDCILLLFNLLSLLLSGILSGILPQWTLATNFQGGSVLGVGRRQPVLQAPSAINEKHDSCLKCTYTFIHAFIHSFIH